MTHQNQSYEVAAGAQLLANEGFEGMASVMQLLLHEATKLERAQYLNANPYQRSDDRRSYANGFKDKTVSSRLGKLELRVPQAAAPESDSYRALRYRFLGFFAVAARGSKSSQISSISSCSSSVVSSNEIFSSIRDSSTF